MKEQSTSKLLKGVISGICVFAMIFSMGILQAFSVSAEVGDPQNAEPCTCNTVFDFDYRAFTSVTYDGDLTKTIRFQVDEDSDKDKVVVVDTNCAPATSLDKYLVNGEKTFHAYAEKKDGNLVPTPILEIDPTDIQQDGKYHLYKSSFTLSENKYNNMRFFEGNPRLDNLLNDLLAAGFQGMTLDFYLSLKVEGDITGADTNNLPVYYFERIFVVDPEAATVVDNNDATGTKRGTISITCNTCGNEIAVSRGEFENTPPESDNPQTGDNTPPKSDNPQTGDNTNLQLWFALLFVSCGAMITLAVCNKKRSIEETE